MPILGTDTNNAANVRGNGEVTFAGSQKPRKRPQFPRRPLQPDDFLDSALPPRKLIVPALALGQSNQRILETDPDRIVIDFAKLHDCEFC